MFSDSFSSSPMPSLVAYVWGDASVRNDGSVCDLYWLDDPRVSPCSPPLTGHGRGPPCAAHTVSAPTTPTARTTQHVAGGGGHECAMLLAAPVACAACARLHRH